MTVQRGWKNALCNIASEYIIWYVHVSVEGNDMNELMNKINSLHITAVPKMIMLVWWYYRCVGIWNNNLNNNRKQVAGEHILGVVRGGKGRYKIK